MFKIAEILKATGGKLIAGPLSAQAAGVSIDSRTIKRNEVFVAIKGDNFDGHKFIAQAVKAGASCVVMEVRGRPVIPAGSQGAAFIAVKNTTLALGGLANFQRRRFAIPVIAITGSNGKTTCKEMTARILAKKFRVLKNEGTQNNQIGLPMTLLRLDSSHDLAVLELGTNHFGEIDYLSRICEPNLGIVTNIGPSHLEYFGDLSGVFKEKSALLKNLKPPYAAVLNADDPTLQNVLLGKNKKIAAFGFGINNRSDFFVSDITRKKQGLEFLVNRKHRFKLKTPGTHNIYNSLAAIAAADIFGVSLKDAAERLAGFEFPAGRLKLKKAQGALFIDDTYNSNPFSLKQALDTLGSFRIRGRKIFIMGDMLELGRHKKLFHYHAGQAAASACDVFITVGPMARSAAAAARDSGFEGKNIFSCNDSCQARAILLDKLSLGKDDVVLVKGSRGMKMEEVLK